MAAEHTARLGARIRDRREALGLRQRDLADLIPGNADSNQISKWERGVHRPSDDTLEHIAVALTTTVTHFLAAEPVEGPGDLMGALGASADPTQLDRIEMLLSEIVNRLARLESATPSGGESLEAELGGGGRPPEKRDDDTEEDEPEDQAGGQ